MSPMRSRVLLLLFLALICTSAARVSSRADLVEEESYAVDPGGIASTAPSGFRLLVDDADALASRIDSIDRAHKTVDLQYYIFEADVTGRLVAQHLLAAADRGVRVRILLDDLRAQDADMLFDALDAHARIEVRKFNPFLTHDPSWLTRIGQLAIDGRRLNRRMHNKSFIVDDEVAIIGGRNIGDAYFDAGDDMHFRDLDALAVGPIVQRIAQAFDIYWNDAATYPLVAPGSDKDGPGALVRLRAQFAAKPAHPRDRVLRKPLQEDTTQWYWGAAQILVDRPAQVEPDKTDRDARTSLRMVAQLKARLGTAQQQVLLVSPYFIPNARDLNFFRTLAQRGVALKVLTNSLAATDEPLVFAGYSRYRLPMLQQGAALYELRPQSGRPQATARGTSSGVSLHAKVFVIDRRYVYIGSMNLDHRSAVLNTELGVMVDSPALAAALANYFERATMPNISFRLALDPPGPDSEAMRWSWIGADGEQRSDRSDPEVPAWRRGQIAVLRVVSQPLEGLL